MEFSILLIIQWFRRARVHHRQEVIWEWQCVIAEDWTVVDTIIIILARNKLFIGWAFLCSQHAFEIVICTRSGKNDYFNLLRYQFCYISKYLSWSFVLERHQNWNTIKYLSLLINLLNLLWLMIGHAYKAYAVFASTLVSSPIKFRGPTLWTSLLL